jgi:rod shape-determining protein MreD
MTPESGHVKKAFVTLAVPVVPFFAVVVQLTVVNRLPLPGAAAPDLVLVFVTAVAVCTSPLAAAVTGFAGGLALDVAPPSTHYAGEYALIFCLAAWGAARAKASIEHATGGWDTMTAFGVMAAAVVAGEAGKAVLGLLLSDPDVTVPAIAHVLPVALVYDLILAPVAAWPLARLARPAADRAPRPEFARAQRLLAVFRLASAGAVPDLRLAGTGQRFQPSPQWAKAGARRVPKLRLSGSSSPAAGRTVAAYSAGATFPLAGGRAAKLNFASGRRPGTAYGQRRHPSTARTPGKNWLASAATSSVRPAQRPAKSPARGWLRSASRSGLTGTGVLGSVAVSGSKGLSGSRAFSRHQRRSGRRVGSALSGAAVLSARSAPSGLSALPNLSGGGAGRRHTPSAGWLRNSPQYGPGSAGAARPRRLRPGRRWLRGARRPGGIPHGNWYAASPSGAWLRRSHNPWRRRRQRLLRSFRPGGRPPVPRSFRPGGRPPVPPGAARPMAKGAIASGARRFGLFGRNGGRW